MNIPVEPLGIPKPVKDPRPHLWLMELQEGKKIEKDHLLAGVAEKKRQKQVGRNSRRAARKAIKAHKKRKALKARNS